MVDIIKDFQGRNIGLVILIIGIILGLKQFWEEILAPLANTIIARYGFIGLIIVIGIIWWLIQKVKRR